ncbi:glycosyltransferase [Persicitalea jodogahamensis]|uniref:Glycosyl transferase n=1 Tax=Persicitalea jodogahamensis TaxID=402147 RepID=A0A8J3D759_9BACT|nr:glycosyltransferase [Persicitalea jodogahamensis]GHB61422.1 glycosyl transferase [Persicitalea jodogahamensis]
MEIFFFLFVLLQAAIGINLVFPLILYGLYHFRKSHVARAASPLVSSTREADYAIIVTAYQQTHQLPEVIESLLRLRYNNYHIYLVGDNCDPDKLPPEQPKLKVLRPESVLSSNTRSHFYAIRRFERPHERLVIIDSDNLVDPELLNRLNERFDQGFQAVQGVREAKNIDTDLARLDAARDIYYHFYDGKLLFGAGSSATLAGSGMAFQVDLYEQCLGNSPVEGAGFDKVLQAEIVRRGERIAFAPEAIVYDEKTTGSQQLVGQRARWINTWFRYFSYGFGILGRGLWRWDRNQILFGIVLLRPPLFLFLLAAVIFALIDLVVFPVMALFWAGGLVAFVVGFLVALRHSQADQRIYASLAHAPRFVFYQLIALLKVKRANKISVATRHGDPDASKSRM